MTEFAVKPEKLEGDGETWGTWGEQLADIGRAVPVVGPGLSILDFSVLPNAQQVAEAYVTVSQALADEVQSGAEQFDAVGKKLTKVAGLYADVEQKLVDTISAYDD